MVTRALALRWLVYTAGYRQGAAKALRKGLTAVLFLALFAAAAVLPQTTVLTTAPRARLLDAFTVSALPLLGALLAGFLADSKLGVRQYASYPVAPAAARGVWISALLSPFAVLLWVFVLVRAVLRITLLQHSLVIEVLAAVLLVFLVTALTQVAIASSQLFLATGFAASFRRWGGLLLFSALVPLAFFVAAEIINGDERPATTTAEILAWSPFGFSYSGSEFWSSANYVGFGFTLIAAVILLVLLYLAYLLCAARLLESTEKPRLNGSKGLGVFDFFPDTPAGVIAARTVIYWRRDPRYFVSLLALPAAAIAVTFAMQLAGMRFEFLVLLPVPVILYLLGWSIHNDIAMDSTAIWMHVASNTRGRDDRIGRLTPIIVAGVPLLVVGTTLSVLLVGKWYIFPVVLGLNTATLLIGSGISTVASAWVVYPSTRPGESPFSQPQYNGAGAAVAQSVSFIGGVLLTLPTIVLAAITLTSAPSFVLAATTLVVGIVSGVCVLLFCIWLGGLIFDRTAPEIVRITEVYD